MEACKTPKRVFGYIAPTYKMAKGIVWRDPRMLKQYLPRGILKKDPNETELYCEFFNDSILQIRGADDPDSLRGQDYYGVILDEFAMMKPSVWEEILRPVLTENGGWAWFLFTPKGKNHAYRYWTRAKGWGKDWEQFFLSVKESNLISERDLKLARQEMPEMLYKQEFLCEFLEGEGSVFKGIERCIVGRLQDPVRGSRYVLGVDLAKTVDFTVLICIDQFEKRVVAFERFNEVSWRLQKDRIAYMAKRYNDALVIVDSTGVGDPITEDLKNIGLSVEGYRFTANSKKALIERLIIAIEQRLILFPHIEVLVDELKSFSYELSGDRLRYSAPEGMHDDCVISLALAVYGIQGFLYSGGDKEDEGELIPRVVGDMKDIHYDYYESNRPYDRYKKLIHPEISDEEPDERPPVRYVMG